MHLTACVSGTWPSARCTVGAGAWGTDMRNAMTTAIPVNNKVFHL